MLERESGSAQYTSVIAKFRGQNPEPAIFPRAKEFGQFLMEHRHQDRIVLRQATPQNQSLRVKKGDQSGNPSRQMPAQYSHRFVGPFFTRIGSGYDVRRGPVRIAGVTDKRRRVHVHLQTTAHTAGAGLPVGLERDMPDLISHVVGTSIQGSSYITATSQPSPERQSHEIRERPSRAKMLLANR